MNNSLQKSTTLLAMASTFTLLGCGGGVETDTDTSAIDVSQPVSGWEMVWSDEFDGSAIDDKKWTHEVNCDGGGNNEQQCYTDSAENSYVSDGKLHIVSLPAAEGAEKPYTSARLVTRNKGDFKYGRFEMKAKLPQGQGSWPAFWMMPTDSVYGVWPQSGEIDIVEAVNLKTVNAEGVEENNVHGTLHYGTQEGDSHPYSGKSYSLPDGANPADDFHVYALEWQEGEMRWYVDGHLYATQRKSEVRTNSKGEAVGLSHRGWFSKNYDPITGEFTTYWNNAPYDQEFFMILNSAVGGEWPEAVNNLGVDAEAFAQGQIYEIDYVRVYQCKQDPITGKGCETVRGGYDSKDDALVEGQAPIPSPPSTGIAQNLTIFSAEFNPNWPAWDCCGGSTPALVEDVDAGFVTEFVVGPTATVNGFISREANITDPAGAASPFDASPMADSGELSFDMKVVSLPNDSSAGWTLKVESTGASTEVSVDLSSSVEGNVPAENGWKTYTFPLSVLAAGGLDLAAIDVVMIFPNWGVGDGAVYRVNNLKITGADSASPKRIVFEDDENTSWPMWDCCGGSTPTVELDDDAHGNVAEFSIGSEPTVMGFISREANITADGVSPSPFDATSILSNGVIQFDMKVVSLPNDSGAAWLFKVESDNAASALELPLTSSVEAVSPAEGVWQTYTFNLSDLADAGLDVSAIDVLMIFPAWGAGDGAIYRVDNVKIYDPNAADDFVGHVLFDDAPKAEWSIWDCCGGSTPSLQNDDTAHGMTAEFTIGGTPTVMGVLADDDVFVDASALLATGTVSFEMKVISAPNNSSAAWLFKIESSGAATAVELPLTDSVEGVSPTVGEWQTYTFTLQSLFDAGLDISQINVLMFFPAWGDGEGAVYRVDNVVIAAP